MPLKPLIAPIFVPASRPDRFGKAAGSGSDAVIIDLEDAVPMALKNEARSNLNAGLRLAVPTIVRINADGTDWHETDLDAVAGLGIGLVCVPKVESVERLSRIGSRLGSGIHLLAQIETARGLENAVAIASHPLVFQLAFGPADFFLDLGIPASRNMASHVLCRLAVASRSAGKALPLDGPAFAVDNPSALVDECVDAIASGAGGKLCIHPSQPKRVLACFLPAPDDVSWARRVVAADRDGGAQLVDGRMIDAPVVAQAKTVIARAQSASFVPVTATVEPEKGIQNDQ